MTVHVTCHAVERYLERIDGSLTHDQARAAIMSHSPVIALAALIGCSTVRLGCGGRLILQGPNVVTALGRHQFPCRDRKEINHVPHH